MLGVIAVSNAPASPKGMILKPGVKGCVTVTILFFGTEAHDGDGSAVEVIGADNDFCFAVRDTFHFVTPLANGFYARFYRFSTAVHRERKVGMGQFAEFFIKQSELVIAERRVM